MQRRVRSSLGRSRPGRSRGLAVVLTAVLGLLVALPAGAVASTTGASDVTGTVWLDLDADGVRDDGEPGRGGVGLTLRTSATILDAVMTDADGNWTLANVQPGTYELLVEPPIDHALSGGTLQGLDLTTGRAPLTVGEEDLEAGSIGLASPATFGPDITTTVDLISSDADTYTWRAVVYNFGLADVTDPIDLRIVLSSGHETTDVQAGGGWACERSVAIVLCTTDTDAPAASALPAVTVTSTPVGDIGTTVEVTATARLEGVFDDAPLNDEDDATASITGDGATTDLDGDGANDITDAGIDPTGLVVAALLALVVGGATLRTTRRTAHRP